MPLCCSFTPLGDPRRRERVDFGMRGSAGIHEDHRARHRAITHTGVTLLGSTVLIFCQKMNATTGRRAFQLVAVEIARQLFALLVQQQPEINWRTKKIRVDHPTSTKNASNGSNLLR